MEATTQHYIGLGLVKHDQAAGALVKDTVEGFVENHLRESTRAVNFSRVVGLLSLYIAGGQIDKLGDVCDLHPREGFNDTDQVLLQQGVVESIEVGADDGVVLQLLAG